MAADPRDAIGLANRRAGWGGVGGDPGHRGRAFLAAVVVVVVVVGNGAPLQPPMRRLRCDHIPSRRVGTGRRHSGANAVALSLSLFLFVLARFSFPSSFSSSCCCCSSWKPSPCLVLGFRTRVSTAFWPYGVSLFPPLGRQRLRSNDSNDSNNNSNTTVKESQGWWRLAGRFSKNGGSLRWRSTRGTPRRAEAYRRRRCAAAFCFLGVDGGHRLSPPPPPPPGQRIEIEVASVAPAPPPPPPFRWKYPRR